MSPTTEDLRARIAAELGDLGALPDLVPAAARAGARTLRRRRLAAGSALGVVAVGGGVLATSQGNSGDSGRVASETAPSMLDALADGHVTDDEWHEAVRGTLEALLPERYGETSIAPPDRNRAQMFHTSGGDPRLQLYVSVSGRDRSDRSDHSCASQGRARDLMSCEEAELGDGWFGVATTERTPATEDGGSAAYGTALMLYNEGVSVSLYAEELDWDGIEPNDPANLSAPELIAMVESPEFLEMTQVGVEWARELPDSETLYGGPRPVWPMAVAE